MDYRLTPDDKERIRLLTVVSREGLGSLTPEELAKLQGLVEKKDYGHSKKAAKSKKKLLNRINIAIYEAEEKRERAGGAAEKKK